MHTRASDAKGASQRWYYFVHSIHVPVSTENENIVISLESVTGLFAKKALQIFSR